MEHMREQVIEMLKNLGDILPDEEWDHLCDDVKELMAPYEPAPELEEIKEVLVEAQKKRMLRRAVQVSGRMPGSKISTMRRRVRLGGTSSSEVI